MILDLSRPGHVSVTDEDGTRPLTPSASEPGSWGGAGAITVRLEPTADGDGLAVRLHAPGAAHRRVCVRWQARTAPGLRLLGDQWERGYGDLEWRGLVPERRMPWYFLAHGGGGKTEGFGVETGANAICWWQADSDGVTLTLGVSNGGRGVLLGDRTLEAATVRTVAQEGTPFDAARALCRRLCPAPRLPDHPIYGANDWYYAYGNSSAAAIRADTERLVALSPEGENRPYSVIDDGWQANRLDPDGAVQQGGPWDRGNARFPDMPGLAAAIRAAGARPGIWIRPLGAPPGTSAARLLPESRVTGRATGGVPALDPSLLENLAQIAADVAGLRAWGFDLIKHDWSTCDILGRWGFQMDDAPTADGWHFADRTRTTAEIVSALYAAIHEGAGDALLIGCNTIGHLGAGRFEIQRTGDDTSGREWERTRKMGINTLAFRMPQHGTFFAADADCVGLTRHVPWALNRQWLDLLARSGTPLFVSADPDAVGPEQAAALKAAFARAALPQPPGEPRDWQDTTCPARWRFGAEEIRYDWYGGDGGAA